MLTRPAIITVKAFSKNANILKGVIITMKKEIKVVAIVLVALIVFLSGYGLGASNGIKIEIGGTVEVNGGAAVNAGAVQQPTVAPTTQAPTTQAPTTQAPAGDSTDAPAVEDTTAAPAGDSSSSAVPSGAEEIAAAYNKAINDYKAYTGKVTLKKTEAIDVKAKDIPSAVEGIVNGVIKKFITSSTEEYTFENGVDVNDANRKISDKIIPSGRNAEVQAAGLASATATANADGGYTMSIKFISETSDFNGTSNTSEPTYHKGAMDPLDLGTLDINPIEITSAAMTYPGAECEATVDGQGRLVKLHCYLPLGGSGTGSVKIIKATIGIEGNMDTTWEMTYA